ncbi:unnamed protein product [Polarella glacialis]|uniref:Guanine nucleotide-binding protein subunit beta-like protein n=1 Tax=Polarella glacialis TaxID=89957 RepID=A0A813JEI6_POLGL|nr:unnamed protein product [Polarella glacialis]
MGCKQSRGDSGGVGRSAYAAADEGGSGASSSSGNGPLGRLECPTDDYVSNICGFGERHFAVGGVDGWLYLYDWQKMCLVNKLKAHKKAVSRVLACPGGQSLFSSSTDGAVALWRHDELMSGGDPAQTFQGHLMAVSALDLVDDWGDAGSGQALVTGSRDCSLRLWDLETGRTLQQNKILRNVVTALRRVPAGAGAGASAVVQASEDLQLRVWDVRVGLTKGPSMAVGAGPNVLLCLDVAQDGSWVACGSKGFSRENCEVKVFDLRSGLKELYSMPCADQTLEALKCTGPDRCLTASKDGHLRALALPEARLISEHSKGSSSAAAGYTALGVSTGSNGSGPVAMAAWAGPEGVGLELLAWPDASLESAPKMRATT